MLIFVIFNPRPAGVWLVTRPAGGGGAKAPPEISQTTGPISKFQTPFDSPVCELPVKGQKFNPEVTDDVTGQVKVRIVDFSGLVTSASKISMLIASKANESAWITSVTDICKYQFLCFVTIIQVKVISDHQVKKVKQKKNRDLELRYMFLGQIFAKNAKYDPKTLFEASNSVKIQNSENQGKVPK